MSGRDEVITWRETSAELPVEHSMVLGLYDDIDPGLQHVWPMYLDAGHTWRNWNHLRCEAPVMWAALPVGPQRSQAPAEAA